jgi:hypothetical protein
MPQDDHRYETHFRPLRPASRAKLIAVFLIGPLLWVIGLALVAVLVKRTQAIEFALLMTAGASTVGFIVLAVLQRARIREEQRYAAGQ